MSPTPNFGYNTPARGDEDWDVPVNENWQNIDADIQAAMDAAAAAESLEVQEDGVSLGEFLAINAGANITAADAGGQVATISAAEPSADLATADGIDFRGRNIGAMVDGTYDATAYADGGHGVAFSANDHTIQSVVVDSDLSGVTTPDLTVELRQYDGGVTDPTLVDSTTVTLTGGQERIPLGLYVPDSGGDAESRYVLQRGPPTGDAIPLRSRFAANGDWSAAAYMDEIYHDMTWNFFTGVQNSTTAGYAETDDWFCFYDWLVGPEADRVTSPWSTDVDEIYMRPTDPLEEFDSVSPRSIWFEPPEGQ